MTLIEREALPIIRDCLSQNRKETGYNIKLCNNWPILDNTPLSLQGIADDLKKIYYEDKRTISTYKVEQQLKKYKFKFSWVEVRQEAISIDNFRSIIVNHYGD